jgi:hypothetical protein
MVAKDSALVCSQRDTADASLRSPENPPTPIIRRGTPWRAPTTGVIFIPSGGLPWERGHLGRNLGGPV